MRINKENEKLFLDLVSGGILTVTKEGTVFNNRTGNFIGKKPNSHGYREIGYKVAGKVKHIMVHRLVYLIYGELELNEDFPIINHIDGNKSNNNISNLERSNDSHNNQHAVDTGLRQPWTEQDKKNFSEALQGEKSSSAKITDEQAKEIRYRYINEKNLSEYKLAKIYNVSRPTINHILTRRTFKHLE